MSISTKIQQRVTLLSDQFDITGASLADFIAGKENYSIAHGFNSKHIRMLTGRADEWVISRSGNVFETSVSGRDKLNAALDTTFQKSYFHAEPISEIKNRYGENIEFACGKYPASAIAKEAAAKAGLNLVWNCPDYYVTSEETESAGFNDTVAGVLFTLIEPFQKTDMYRVEVTIENDVIYVKKRTWPYRADYTISLADMRIKRISITKRNDDRSAIRNIYISREGNANIKITDSPSTNTHVVETFDINGKLLTREIFTTSYFYGVVIQEERLLYTQLRDKNGNLVSEFENDVSLAQRETTTYDYGGTISSDYNKIYTKDTIALIYDPNPDPLAETKRYKSKDRRATVAYTYSAEDEIMIEDTIVNTKEILPNGNYKINTQTKKPMNTVEQSTIAYRRLSKDLVETTQTQYLDGRFVDKKVTTQSGQMPGPKRVGRTRNVNSSRSSFWYKKIVVSPTGRDIEYQDNRLTEQQLSQIAEEIRMQHTHRKYGLNIDLIPMPWLKKGMCIKINGTITDGLGNSFDLSQLTFAITDVSSTLTGSEYVGSLQGEAWL